MLSEGIIELANDMSAKDINVLIISLDKMLSSEKIRKTIGANTVTEFDFLLRQLLMYRAEFDERFVV